jgi:hypothetical protein
LYLFLDVKDETFAELAFSQLADIPSVAPHMTNICIEAYSSFSDRKSRSNISLFCRRKLPA